MSKRKEYLMNCENPTWIHVSNSADYDRAVISEYKESLVGNDVNDYLKNNTIDAHFVGHGLVMSFDNVKEACAMVAAKYEKQLEGMVNKEDAVKAFKKAIIGYAISEHSIWVESCLNDFENILNQLNK